MAYITNQDVIDRLGTSVAAQLSSETGSSVNAAVVTEVVNAAEGEVNGILAAKFATPVDVSVDAERANALKGVTLKVAVYHLMSRRPPVSETYTKEHDEAIAWLHDVAAGRIKLPGALTPVATATDEPSFDAGYNEQNAATMRDM